jgi:hypothetical protein
VLTELQPQYRQRIAQASIAEAKAMRQKLETHPKYPLQFTTLNGAQRAVWQQELKSAEAFDVEQAKRWAPNAPAVYAAFKEEQQKVAAEVSAQRYPWERAAAR